LRWRHLREVLPEIHPVAVDQAISETNLPDDAFPPACPFTIDQILDEAFFPE